ncbi:hypothetical protein CJ226_17640 [Microbacterium sp. UMB0228]|nr:hypothetical protein CJ226_17640 [Microbacterium sp. UMB0228]
MGVTRHAERLARTGTSQTLTDAELDLAHQPTTRDPRPKKVRAWVRFRNSPAEVDALVHAWTERAAAISFELAGKTYRTWVWASAVRSPPR